MIYEIINPSDAYTIKSDDFLIAAVAVAILGNGQYGIEGTPVLFGWDAWAKDRGINFDDFLAEHRLAIADALDTVIIGSVDEREDVEDALQLMPEDQRQAWLARRHDRKRSSMNNIGAHAKRLAKRLREWTPKAEPADLPSSQRIAF